MNGGKNRRNTSFKLQQKADANGWIKNDMVHKNHTANLSNVCSDCHKKFTKNEIVHKRVKLRRDFN